MSCCPAGTELSSLGRQVLPGDRPNALDSAAPIQLGAAVLGRADEVAELLLGELCLASKQRWESSNAAKNLS